MNKLLGLLQKFDSFIFFKIDSLKTSENFLKMIDNFSALTPLQQKIASSVFSTLLIMPPLLIVLIMFFSNYSLKSTVDSKKDIVASISKYTTLKSQIGSIGTTILSKKAPVNAADLKRQIKNLGTNMANLKITNFKNEKSKNAKNIVNIEADISFKKLSLTELAKFLSQISLRQKARISAIKINKSRDLLQGLIHIKQFGTK